MPITKPTVLILGAGASQEYGFPLGIGLRNDVCELLADRSRRRVLLDVGHSEKQIDDFRDELRYSGWWSVDIFLEENPDLLEIGKHAIATALLPRETEASLFPPN